ncbi:acyl carrier protein [candidate division KSB1 bacterium]|nr:acyl carrier protein [candidate division KSB1 bacterium]
MVDELKKFLIEQKYLENADELGVDDSLLEQGVIDSVGIQQLVNFLEEKYKIKVEEDDLMPDNFDSLSAIEEYVNDKKA